MTPSVSTPEFARIAQAFGWSQDGIGIGDDAAVLPTGQVLCCDALSEGVHFRWDWSSPQDVGWKAVMANVADVLAMGASPTFAVWSVGMGKSWTDSVFAGLAEGALQACAQYGIQLVGGDTVRCLDSGFVSLTLLGQPWGQPWLRSGAKAGDWLVVCGDLGYSAAGLALLQHAHVWPTELDVLVERHRRPRCPAVASLQALGAAVHAALDVSDGLSSECQHLAHQSGVGIVLKPYFWPADPLLEQAAQWLNQSSLGWVLHGGEDHSCLLAVAPHTPLPASCRVLGECVAGEGVWLETPEHTKQLLTPHGWTHT